MAFYFLSGKSVPESALIEAISLGELGAEITPDRFYETRILNSKLRGCFALRVLSNNSAVIGLDFIDTSYIELALNWLNKHDAKAHILTPAGLSECFSGQIQEFCHECDSPLNGQAVCDLCGAFNILRPASDSQLKLLTLHRNPLSLIDVTTAFAVPATSEEMLEYRYQLSLELEDSSVRDAAETEFAKKLAPLLLRGQAGPKTMRLWLDYWARLAKTVRGCQNKLAELRQQGQGHHKLIYVTLAEALYDLLNEVVANRLSDADDISPLIVYAIHADTFINHVDTYCYRHELHSHLFARHQQLCLLRDDLYFLEDNTNIAIELINELVERKRSGDEREKYSIFNNIEACARDIGRSLDEIDQIEHQTDSSIANFFVSIDAELLALVETRKFFNIDFDAWFLHVLCRFEKTRREYSLEEFLLYYAQGSCKKTDLISLQSELDDEYFRFVEGAKQILVHLEATLQHAPPEPANKAGMAINLAWERLNDMRNRLDGREAERKQESDHEDELRRNRERGDEMIDRLLTKQVALRQRSEGNYFLSEFTKSFGAETGTYWEGFWK